MKCAKLVVGFFFRIQPGAQAGFNYSSELAWDQLVAGVLAVALAVIFGRYAVRQAELARISLDQFRQARQEDRVAEDRNLFLALLYELRQNQLSLLALEGRIRMPRVFSMRTNPGIERAVFDVLIDGPIWRSHHYTEVLPSVENAYTEMARLYVSLQPHPPWWAFLIAGESAAAWTVKSSRGYAVAGTVAIGAYAVWIVYERFAARREGRVKRTRLAVEAAMSRVCEVVFGVPVPWDSLDSAVAGDGFAILPERRP